MSLYTHDAFAAPHHQSTAYIIYIGGNDIFHAFLTDFLHFKWGDFYHTVKVEIASNVQLAINQLTTYQQQNPKASYDIFVISSFNEGKSPHMVYSYHGTAYFLVSRLLSWSLKTYNHQLQVLFSQSADPHVHFIDLANDINPLLATPTYQTTVEQGLMCVQDNPPSYIMPRADVGQCQYNASSNEDYFFWNGFHPTSAINQQSAAFIYHDMMQKKHAAHGVDLH